MIRKQGNEPHDLDLAYKGMIPWSRQEFNWVITKYLDHEKQTKANQELRAQYSLLKEEMDHRGKKIPNNFNTMILLNEIFHDRYPNKTEAMAHFFRYHNIYKFLDKYRNELIKEGFLEENPGKACITEQLIDSLCLLPYSLEQVGPSGNKSYTFLYSEVVKTTKAKINAHLN